EREARAQRLLPSKNFIEARLQRRQVELPAQAHGCRYVVSRAIRVKLVQKPHALLREARQVAAICRRGRERRRLPDLIALRAGGDRFGKLRDRRVLEELAQREVVVEGVAQTRDQPRRQNRMAAEIKEVIVNAYAPDAEH